MRPKELSRFSAAKEHGAEDTGVHVLAKVGMLDIPDLPLMFYPMPFHFTVCREERW